MKNTAKLILLALAITLASCSKSSDDNPNPSGTSSKVEQVSGDWTVTYFFDSGKDETHKFSGYSFAFGTDGKLTASGNNSTFAGTWWIGNSGSDDDNSSNKLNIMITGNDAMDELQDDWLIVSLSDKEVRLKDDGDNSNEELRFGR
jgi:hypothetical protein